MNHNQKCGLHTLVGNPPIIRGAFRFGSAFALLVALAGCAAPLSPNVPGPEVASSPISWRADPDCLAKESLAPTRHALAGRCAATNHNFVALALSGGGTKAAAFSGEVMFYLQALGLLQQTSMISSVSGGSFAAALYALSCDQDDAPCLTPKDGLTRPLWTYGGGMNKLAQGYNPLLERTGLRLFVPFVKKTVSPEYFASFIDAQYLGIGNERRPTFADLNPRRPTITLNTTLLSEFRPFLEQQSAASGYLRRRTPDEFFHFSFTDYYFNRIGSDLAKLPLSYGVAASAAFPLLIDYVRLNDFRGRSKDDPLQLQMLDGGANDNQGLIEIYLTLVELLGGQHRSDLSGGGGADTKTSLQRLAAGDHALVFVSNASLTEATGLKQSPAAGAFSWLPIISTVLDGVARAEAEVDTYSAVSYNLRKQLYLRELELLKHEAAAQKRILPSITLSEIGLTELDRYAEGGVETSLTDDAGLLQDETDAWFDPERQTLKERKAAQSKAYARFKDAGYRHRLGLSDYHPQCYFEKAKGLDTTVDLAGLPEKEIGCIRQAARWAAALRAQELCDAMSKPEAERPLAPSGFHCANGKISFAIDDKKDPSLADIGHARTASCPFAEDGDFWQRLQDANQRAKRASSPAEIRLRDVSCHELTQDGPDGNASLAER